jgi:hypothetical protein
MNVRLSRPVLCPICRHEMGKHEMKEGGFRCPGCGEWLQIDTDRAYGIAKAALWGFAVTLMITAFAGFPLHKIIFWTVGVSLGISVVVGAIGGWFFPKLSGRASLHTRGNLSILPPDDTTEGKNTPR